MIVFWSVGIGLGLALAYLERRAEQAHERRAREQLEKVRPMIEGGMRLMGTPGKATMYKNPRGPGYIVDVIYD
jgi:hypothetical protein